MSDNVPGPVCTWCAISYSKNAYSETFMENTVEAFINWLLLRIFKTQ